MMTVNSHHRVLYVEDDRLSRMVVQILLTEIMHFEEVVIFEDSRNFMERMHELDDTPNLILLDVQMKPHDGYEVLRMLRNDAQYQDATVVALTANVMAHDVNGLKEAGFDGLIGKPIIEEIFPQLMEKILQGESIWYVP